MTGETDLRELLTSMRPRPNPGRYVFITVDGDIPPGVRPVVTVAEQEGLTLVVPQRDADAAGLKYDYVAGWITLGVHSALDAVGLTAAVARELAAAGLSCNVVAGFYHDHLFVPYQHAARAVGVLENLSRRSARSRRREGEPPPGPDVAGDIAGDVAGDVAGDAERVYR
ncbi:ACT domain-containing protein [Microbispora cellulosiformans]|uniref:ACT domain-containing protein n=1 Tax=Microbispora cellulosiformans TaxID=2614688 RepID=A0A5J5K5X5_9ACTN|nr:ACT domain-containing protein [Microbispora cellulosiformans]KAA9378500.1 ACT domain-containing protein [Microbispora cellulosiformans]